ncbi:four helix bundle protein [Adhaeribacter rhizoryzae]|uniref:Four helix bundle protein n=1 Tax=Adhaeribacter rhizoryzae TaxID=2607907 RepID=A0A5M6DFQ2_9BACT|nr:four helix bundle protein [Adhaeribacter rhizoryzae]KAA5544025.1 four helix bundle protein [Adhaeribacter rhizoryzae]
MHNFKELRVWQEAMELAKNVYLISTGFPTDEKFGLTSQVRRAAISIPSNIAEGAGRSSDKEFNHFLSIALGSAYELQTQVLLAESLGFVDNQKIEALLKDIELIQKRLFSFKKILINKIEKS